MSSGVIIGNSIAEGKDYQGWFMGHFISPSSDPRSTNTVELKWGTHRQGDRREDWTKDTRVTSLSILISGRFRLEFSERSVLLAQQGDYAMWLPGVEHWWEAEADTTILTVRFPSMPSP
ncbi:signal peptidase I [Leptolyngbya sp. FACHB-711]|uniref:signal peptidase I n=1 Tax=unclassified Leptolyngbya TaxID=2650499 RepID=UPI0016849016|nr:signal peptidase I [Leptolyngbya sp. FACHB-711]MBD1850494.1 signal peptidase I [Cyanobacteria bacterium FACHB-502]MBD2023705.1 signal peptidase I [Leptolyngbya sp. FACHB-711]